MADWKHLTEMEIDVLGEIGNIGSGNAATALSEILQQPVNIDVPEVLIMDYDNVMEMLGGPEEIISAVLMEISGDLSGIMLFIQEKDFAEVILDSLVQHKIEKFSEMDDMDKSAMMEVGNILMASYTNAVGDMTGLRVENGVPDHTVNMAGAILTIPLISVAESYDYVVLIRANFVINEERVSGNIFMVLDNESLTKMMIALGIEME